MECKEASASVISTVWWCINRNIMECKDTPSSVTVEGEKVLIETLWNVKTIRQAIYRGENMY